MLNFNGNEINKVYLGGQAVGRVFFNGQPAHYNARIATPDMTGDTTPEGECFGSPPWDVSYSWWKAFNRTRDGGSDSWVLEKDYVFPAYLGYKFANDTPHLIIGFDLGLRTTVGVDHAPRYITVQGSNDGNTWEDVATVDYVWQTGGEEHRFLFLDNMQAFIYWRLKIDGNQNDGPETWCDIGELSFLEPDI